MRPGYIYARITSAVRETVYFDAPGQARRCAGKSRQPGVMIEGIALGNGILMLARGLDTGSVSYPVLPRGDSTTYRGSMVSSRYMLNEIARGVALDSGTLQLQHAANQFSGRVAGSGLDYTVGRRVSLEVTFDSVPMMAETIPCQVKL